MDQVDSKQRVQEFKTARRYLKLIEPNGKIDKVVFHFRAIWPKERAEPNGPRSIKVSGTIGALFEELCDLNDKGYGVFVTVNATDGEGVKTKNIVGVRALWADWDEGRPENIPIKPSFVIQTSRDGLQAYWLLDDEMTNDQFDACMACIVSEYGGDPNCKDIARVLRVPGFFHTKGEPWLVHFADARRGDVQGYLAAELQKAFLRPEEKRSKSKTLTSGLATGILANRGGFGDGDIAEIEAALDVLPIKDFRARDRWREIVSAIHYGTAGSDDGHSLAREWSEGDPKSFSDGSDFEGLWKSLSAGGSNGDPITLGTLFAAAKEYGHKPSAFERMADLEEVEVSEDMTASEFGLEVESWKEEEKQEFFSRMNKEHALVTMGSSIRYLHERHEHDGTRGIYFLQPDGMKRLYANVIVPVGDRKLNGFDAWDRWKGRRQCRGVALFPGAMQVPPGYINLWRGFAVEPRKGRWNLFDDHLYKIVCSGSDEYYTWLVDWLAHMFQHPEEKPGSAVVLKSEVRGTGKSMIFQLLRRILGVHAMSVSQASHVVGNFNGHLMQNVLLGVEEAFWAGNKASEGVIKNLITEPTITIEQKGIDAISAPNFTRLLINSNESWTVPVGIDERRFLVLEVKNKRAKDKRYFDPIFAQMKDGGLEAMLYDLLRWDIQSNLRNPPETKALEQEREYSLDGVHKWLCEVARSGCVYDKARGTDLNLDEEGRTELDRAVVREAARDYCAPYEVRSLDTRLGLLLKNVGVESSQPRREGRRSRVYVFPPIQELREAVERVVRVSASEGTA